MSRSRIRPLVGGYAAAGWVAIALVAAACGGTTSSAAPAVTAGEPVATAAATPVAPAPSAAASSSAETEVAEPSPESSVEAASTVRIPLVACPTTYGADAASPSPLPATISAVVDAGIAATVSFYGNEAMTVLAPKGWDCTGAIGADGSASMTVTPPGSPLPSGSPPPAQQAVTAYAYGACVGCIATDACPVFPEAWALSGEAGACPASIPKQERITRRSPQTAVFDDPPGVAGTGTPSGGTYRALGFMVFDPGGEPGSGSASVPSLLKVTCTLPDALSRICEETVEGVR